MSHSHWLTLALTYLAAAVIAVPLARRLGVGAVIGYLVAGFAIGPWGLRLVTDPSQIVDLAEFGVVLMLFLIGLELVDIARDNFPNLTIVARARNVQHWYQLNERGVHFIERETLDAALMSARSVLELMGYEPHRARTLAMRFRRHSVQQLHELAPHFRDESKLISLARAGRQQLEQLFAQERLDRPPVPKTWEPAHNGDESFDELEGPRAAADTAGSGAPEH